MQTAQANPVPYPMIGMPFEYIYANITVADNGATAKVNGTYPFYNEAARMFQCHTPCLRTQPM
jgi:hypothetical protein